MTPRLCRLCHERPVSPARVRARDYRCNRCRNRTASHQRASAKYRHSPRGRVIVADGNATRIYIGSTYHSRATDAYTARAINAHIKERCRAFVKGLQDRKETQGPASG